LQPALSTAGEGLFIFRPELLFACSELTQAGSLFLPGSFNAVLLFLKEPTEESGLLFIVRKSGAGEIWLAI
jgi:hypothetical protein